MNAESQRPLHIFQELYFDRILRQRNGYVQLS